MSQYIDRNEAMKSYRPLAGSMSPGLKRAREPFRVKNAILGVSLAAVAVGIWAYSISAVRQDVFDDLDEEAEGLAATGTGTGLGIAVLAKAVEDTHAGAGASSSSTLPSSSTAPSPSPSPLSTQTTSPILNELSKIDPDQQARARGLLSHLDSRLPWLLDPERKTLVWGAPPVDNIGKMRRPS